MLEGRLQEAGFEPDQEDEGNEDDLAVLNAIVAETEGTSRLCARTAEGCLRTSGRVCPKFGMHNLSQASLKGNANLSLVKGGVATSYSKVTEGEKLRLKVATVLAMIEVAEKKGVGRHPGLLMIDSPAAQEVSAERSRRIGRRPAIRLEEHPHYRFSWPDAPQRDHGTRAGKESPRSFRRGLPVVTGDGSSVGRHPIEANLMALLEIGQEPSIAALGGLEAIASAVQRLSASPLMPEVLRPLLRYWDHAPAQDRTLVASIIRNLLEGASADYVLIEAVDILDTFRPLPDGAMKHVSPFSLQRLGGARESSRGWPVARRWMELSAGPRQTGDGSCGCWISFWGCHRLTRRFSFAMRPRSSAFLIPTGASGSCC